jgi:hypothetical protein
MKIGILTQPLQNNYGGLLQAYALQTILKRMGHDVWTINRQFKNPSILVKVVSVVKPIVIKYLFHNPVDIKARPTTLEKQVIAKNTDRFIKENIRMTENINTIKKLSILNKYQFDAYVVGSDQVWRPGYSPCLTNYFLDFLKNENTTKRVAFAASFGVDNWEYNNYLTRKCKKLALKFNTISVREESAVQLCKENFDVDATLVLDPTLMLDKEDYIALIEKDKMPKKEKTLMVYILDQTPEKLAITEIIKRKLNLEINSVMPKMSFSKEARNNINECVYPPVSEWLNGFKDAKFVVTDSFHGTAFSIIFNIPFIVIGNNSRGLTRFSSLLKIFGLENRMISKVSELSDKSLYTQLNFEKLNKIRDENKKISYNILEKALAHEIK